MLIDLLVLTVQTPRVSTDAVSGRVDMTSLAELGVDENRLQFVSRNSKGFYFPPPEISSWKF